ncbi:MAG TPA: peptidase M20, partial [Bryobacteraceae bacterium]
MSEAIDRYVKENETRFLEELKDFLRIPSISTLPENNEATHRAADFVADHLMAAGMEHVEVIETERHPLVYADWLHAPGKPTVLCY